jgi:membrane protein YqaA with SNARE-associated domain
VTAQLAALGWLFVVVSFGAVVPVVPTGAAVSSGAALAFHNNPLLIALVIAAGAAGAYAGDLVMYAMCRAGGEQLARRLHWLRDEEHLTAVKERLHRSQIPVLLVSRLLPGGRVPGAAVAHVPGGEPAGLRALVGGLRGHRRGRRFHLSGAVAGRDRRGPPRHPRHAGAELVEQAPGGPDDGGRR